MKIILAVLIAMASVAGQSSKDILSLDHPIIGKSWLAYADCSVSQRASDGGAAKPLLFFGYEFFFPGREYRIETLQIENDGAISMLMSDQNGKTIYININSEPEPGATFSDIWKFVKDEVSLGEMQRVAPLLLDSGHNWLYGDFLEKQLVLIESGIGENKRKTRIFGAIGATGYFELVAEQAIACDLSVKLINSVEKW